MISVLFKAVVVMFLNLTLVSVSQAQQSTTVSGPANISPIGGSTDNSAFCPVDPVSPGACPVSSSSDSTSFFNQLQPSGLSGNPISLFNGNKYQLEVDYDSTTTALQFLRHYNSNNSDLVSAFGNGWTTTVGAKITSVGGNGFDILQGNGAILQFRNKNSTSDGSTQYQTENPSNGYVISNENKTYWHIPDGRKLSFLGSFLVRIDFPGNRYVTLFYVNKKIAEIKDETGRVMQFEFYPNETGLVEYGKGEFSSQPGHLSKLTMPDGKAILYKYDSHRNLSKVIYEDETSRQYHYENEVYPTRLTGITNRLGIRYVSWAYDDHGRAVSSSHINGVESVEIDVRPADDEGGIGTTYLTNSEGLTSTYTWQVYSNSNQMLLLSSEGPGCSTCPKPNMRYSYNENFQIISEISNDGTQSRYSYDAEGRLTDIIAIDRNGTETHRQQIAYTENSFTPSSNSKISVNPAGRHEVVTEYNQQMLPISVTEKGFSPAIESLELNLQEGNIDYSLLSFDSIQRTTRFFYSEGRLIKVDGPREDVEDVTTMSYDSLDRLTSIALSTGQKISVGDYDEHGQPQLFVIGSQEPMHISYDDNRNIEHVKKGSHSVTYLYDVENRLISVTDSFGRGSYMSYDDAGRQVQSVDHLGHVTDMVRDSENRLTSQSMYGLGGELIRSFSRVYDANGRLQSGQEQLLNDSTGNMVSSDSFYNYDALGNLSALSNAQGQQTDLTFDAAGRLLDIAPLGVSSSSIEYDSKGQNISYTDARGNRTISLKDDFGRVVAHISPDTGTTLYSYDAADNRTQMVNANGQATDYKWDAANRLVEESNLDGLTEYEYHPSNGRLIRTSNDATVEHFTYNDNAQLISHTRLIAAHSYTTTYEYNEYGSVKSKRLPNGQILQYHYHQSDVNAGSLKAITRSSLLGLMEETLLGEIDLEWRDGSAGYLAHNGVRTDYRFGPSGTLSSIDVGTTLTLDYTFDDNGNIVGIIEGSIDQQFQYSGNKLIEAHTKLGSYRYEYDSASNRTASLVNHFDGSSSQSEFEYNENGKGNQLLAVHDVRSGWTTDYTYDSTGAALSSGDGITYEYNVKQRPIKVYKNGQLLAKYWYNSFGERIKKTVLHDGQEYTTHFLFDGSDLAAEIDLVNDSQSHYLYLDNRPVVKLVDKEVFALHVDHNGTPRKMTDGQAQLVWSADYSPFGEATITLSNATLNLRMPGQYEDSETGTHYNYRRNYDPATGRYTTSDPIGLRGGKNTYVYAEANPIRFVDPLGLEAELTIGVAVGVGTRLALQVATLGASLTPAGWAVVGVVALASLYYASPDLFSDEGVGKPSAADYDALLAERDKFRPWAEPTRFPWEDGSWRSYFELQILVLDAQRRYAENYEYMLANPSAPCPVGGQDSSLYLDALTAIAISETASVTPQQVQANQQQIAELEAEIAVLNNDLGLDVLGVNNESDAGLTTEEVALKQQQYDIMKGLSDLQFPPPPPPGDPLYCAWLSAQLHLVRAILNRYKAWDARWYPGRHATKILERENRYRRLVDKHQRNCT